MERLHMVQEQNKKEIQQVSSNLEFQKEQVAALQLTAQSQQEIMEKLHVDIAHLQLRKLIPSPNDPPLEEVKRTIKSRTKALEEIRQRTNELSSNIKSLRRIQNVEESERDRIVTELRHKVVASNIRLKSTTMELEANTEILNRDLTQCHREWKSVHVQVALMERVSQKQLRRVTKKVSQGKYDEVPDLVYRAKTAVEEELMMRRNDPCPATQWIQECEQVDTILKLLLKCCKALVEGITPVLTKQVTHDVSGALVSLLDESKRAVESCRDNTDAFLIVLEEKLQAYETDEALLPPTVRQEIQEESEKSKRNEESEEEREKEGGRGDVGAASATNHGGEGEEEGDNDDDDDDEGTTYTAITDTTDVTDNKGALLLRTIGRSNEIEDIMKREVELDELIRNEQKRLEDVRERALSEAAAWKSKLQELRQMFKKGKVDWSKKDHVLNRALAEVEDLKTREDKLRRLVRKGRSKLKKMSRAAK